MGRGCRSFVVLTLVILAQLSLTRSQKCTRNDTRHLYPTCMIEAKVNILWCDESNYTKVPDASKIHATQAEIRATTTLLINDSCLARISEGDLSSFPNLAVLDAEKNMITALFSGAFSSNRKLQILNFRNNFIAKIDVGAFRGIRNLTKLLLDSNRLSDIPILKAFGNLEELSLNFNKITMLQRSTMSQFKKLRILRIQGNIVSDIEEFSFRGLSNLSHVYLDGNNISQIDEDTFGGLQNLQVLTLSHNRIGFWPKRYGVLLSNLHTLHLGSNNIQVFTGEHVRNLSKLQNLSLDDNSLSVVPEDVLTSLEQLRYLNLSGNFLKDLPRQAFSSSCYLTVLHISDNELSIPQVEWFQHFASGAIHNVEVKMDRNPWNCSCNIIPYQSFVEKLDEKRETRSLAEQIKISCTSPKYARDKTVDADLIEEIKFRSHCPATSTPSSPTSNNEIKCNYSSSTTELFITSEMYVLKEHTYEITMLPELSSLTTASSSFLESDDNGTSKALMTMLIMGLIMVVVLGVLGLYCYRRQQKRKGIRTSSTSSGRVLLYSQDSEPRSPSEKKKDEFPTIRTDEDNVFASEQREAQGARKPNELRFNTRYT